MGGQPSGTVTFLFTDIEGSTAQWERDRESMSTALRTPRRSAAGGDRVPRRVGVQDRRRCLLRRVRTGRGRSRGCDGRAGASGGRVGCRRAVASAWPSTPAPPRSATATTSARPSTGSRGCFRSRTAARCCCRAPASELVRRLSARPARSRRPPAEGPGRPEHVFQLAGPGLRSEFPPLASADRGRRTCHRRRRR